MGLASTIEVLKAIEAAGHAARMAGGCVRDRLMGHEPSDFDIATSASPEEILSLGPKSGYKVIPTGLQHGTVMWTKHGESWEITTLRRDVATDGRHATVSFDQVTFEHDAARRDFTINAMYEDRHGKIYDFFSGQDDLNQKRLRFVGNPTSRIQEDYLRILRFFRFLSGLGFTPDAASLSACISLKDGLKQISHERIAQEFLLTIATSHASKSIALMVEHNIMPLIAPDFAAAAPSTNLSATAEHLFKTLPESHRKDFPEIPLVFLLCGFDPKNLTPSAPVSLAKHLRLSNDIKEKMLATASCLSPSSSTCPSDQKTLQLMEELDRLSKHYQSSESLIEFLRSLESAIVAANLPAPAASALTQNVRELYTSEKSLGALRQSQLPLNGDDIMRLIPGIEPKKVGVLLSELKSAFRLQKIHNRSAAEHLILDIYSSLPM
jgi:tRNA nucleotidyltransferase/poly(A) polymerase